MIRIAVVLAILQKELLETLRDRRTLFRMVLLPILLYPVLALGLSKLEGNEADARAARTSRVAVWGELPVGVRGAMDAEGMIELAWWQGAPDEVRRDLQAGKLAAIPTPDAEDDPPVGQKQRKAPWVEPENPVIAAARAALARREVVAVMVPWPGFGAALIEGRKAEVSIYFDSAWADSMLARDRLERGLRAARREARFARETARSLPPGFSDTVSIMTRNVAPVRRAVGQFLGAIMPVLMIVMSLLGGFLPAIDLTAGEKERGTMQTLLCAPLRPIEIITGKFLTVFVVSLLAALANVASLSITIRRLIPFDIGIPWSIYALTFVVLVPVSFFFSAIFLAVAAFARDFKDGQNALTPVYLPILMASAVTALPGVELNAWTAFVPVLDVALLIKALFVGEAPAELVFLVLLASTLWAALALLVAARVFEAENVLLGGKEPLRALLLPARPKEGSEPTAGFAITFYAIALVVSFYGSLLIASAGPLVQVLVTEYAFLLAPVLAAVALMRFPWRDTLALRAPPLRGVLGAILIGVSGWTIAATLVRLLPPPRAFVEKLSDTLLLGGQPFPVVLLVAAVTPAICEELFFRGLVFAGLKRHGAVVTLLVSALLFALLHGSIYRLLPTFFLGAVMGWARMVTRSIAPGMIVHALNNGIAVGILFYKPSWVEKAAEAEALPIGLVAAGVAVFAAGMAVLPRRPGVGQ